MPCLVLPLPETFFSIACSHEIGSSGSPVSSSGLTRRCWSSRKLFQGLAAMKECREGRQIRHVTKSFDSVRST